MLVITGVAVSKEPPKVHKDSMSICFGKYCPTKPKNWESIPEPARTRIITHLKNRLGEAFYTKLSLVGGQIIDFEALREKDPDSKNYQWEVPAYLLNLRFTLPELGIEHYDACIQCRLDGTVIHEIDLPEIAKHPDRAQFISASKAFEIAEQNGIDTTETTLEVEINYAKDLGVCVFTFMQLTRHDGPRLLFKCIDIDAHSGKVLKKYDCEAIE
jgi:hypothetical protein